MNPWSIWTWLWAATMDMCQRALESIAVGIEAASADDHVPTAREQPEWTTPNHEIIDLAALRLRDFSVGKSRHRPVVVVAPFALHDAGIADLAPGHSLVEALRANGCPRLFLVEWKSATPETRLHTIDTQLAALNVAIDDIGSPMDLIGLCQGGWLSLVYAARFPKKVRRLVLVGAPVDIKAELSLLSTPANPMTDVLIDELVRLGDGLVLGRYMAALWPRELDETSSVIKSLQTRRPASDRHRTVRCGEFCAVELARTRFAGALLSSRLRLALSRKSARGRNLSGARAQDRSAQSSLSVVPARGRPRRDRAAGPGLRGSVSRSHPRERHRDGAGSLRAFRALHGQKHAKRGVAAHCAMACKIARRALATHEGRTRGSRLRG